MGKSSQLWFCLAICSALVDRRCLQNETDQQMVDTSGQLWVCWVNCQPFLVQFRFAKRSGSRICSKIEPKCEFVMPFAHCLSFELALQNEMDQEMVGNLGKLWFSWPICLPFVFWFRFAKRIVVWFRFAKRNESRSGGPIRPIVILLGHSISVCKTKWIKKS